MAEGTKDLSQDMQAAAQIKAGHQFLAIDPDTGMVVGVTTDKFAEAIIVGNDEPTPSDDPNIFL